VLIRKQSAARSCLLASGVFIFALTMIFGLIKPLSRSAVSSGIPFTLLAGSFISAGWC
jgi:hypothetical protein